jgi:NADH-quinone oxidoreductase subunit K
MNPFFGNINFSHYILLGIILFIIGAWGMVFNRKSIITALLSLEVMLLGININFVSISVAMGDLMGQVFTLFILTVAAAEAAIGLAILVIHYRNTNNIQIENVNIMKG